MFAKRVTRFAQRLRASCDLSDPSHEQEAKATRFYSLIAILTSQTLGFTAATFKTMGLDAHLAPLGDVPTIVRVCLAIAVALELIGASAGGHAHLLALVSRP